MRIEGTLTVKLVLGGFGRHGCQGTGSSYDWSVSAGIEWLKTNMVQQKT